MIVADYKNDIVKGDSVNETVLNLLEGTNTNWLVEKQPLVSTC